MKAESKPSSLRIGDWIVRPRLGELRRGSEVEQLRPTQMAVLCFLASRGGDVASKEELLDEVWGETFVEDTAVARTIYVTPDTADFALHFRVDPEAGSTRITTLFQDLDAGEIPWSDASLVSMGELPAWVERTAVEVVGHIPGQSSPDLESPRSSPRLPPAYVRGAHLARQTDLDSIVAGIEELNDVVAAHPDFAPAYAELAAAHLQLRQYPQELTSVVRQVEEAAERALELDPSNVIALRALAEVDFRYRFDWQRAGERLDRALQIAPHDIWSLLASVRLDLANGRFDRALANARLASQLSHESDQANFHLMTVYMFSGALDEAVQFATEALSEESRRSDSYSIRQLLIDTLALSVEACERRSGFWQPFALVDPRLAPLRNVPGLDEVERCLGEPVEAVPFSLAGAE